MSEENYSVAFVRSTCITWLLSEVHGFCQKYMYNMAFVRSTCITWLLSEENCREAFVRSTCSIGGRVALVGMKA